MSQPVQRRHRAAAGTTVALTLFGVIAVAAILLAAQAFTGGNAAPTPANSAAPLTTVVGAEVVETVITGEVTGEAAYSRDINRPVLTSGTGIVTRDGARSGGAINAGDAVAFVNEQPVFVFQGIMPAYRGLTQDAEGEDVRQLRQGLADLGYDLAVTSRFDWNTSRALWQFYTDRGVPPISADGAQLPAWDTNAGVPLGIIQFLPQLPATATSDCGNAGTISTATLCTVEGGAVTPIATIAAADAAVLTPGMRANVVLDNGTSHEGTVSAITVKGPDTTEGDDNTADASASPVASVTIALAQADVVLTTGASGDVTFFIAQSQPGDLTIAVSAIRSDNDRWWLVDTADKQIRIDVGLCGGGRCVIQGDGVTDGLEVLLVAG